MDIDAIQVSAQNEEQLVGQLQQLGVSYLSRQGDDPTPTVQKPDQFQASLVCQRSSRVRTAVIALFLARPDFARHIQRAIRKLDPWNAQVLRLFYTAAVYLQEEHIEELHARLGKKWEKLPDLFGKELGVSGDSPQARLHSLAAIHARESGEVLNWAGTYVNAAQHLFHRWEKEQVWKK